MGHLFKLTFWRLILSTPKCCHIDLWLPRLVLTHHHPHRLHLLPSATSPGVRVSSFPFYPWCFLSGGLPFALFSVKFRAVFQLSFLSKYFVRVALLFSPLAPVWLSGQLSHWSGSWTVPLTLVLRLLASTELQLHWTSFLCLVISKTV